MEYIRRLTEALSVDKDDPISFEQNYKLLTELCLFSDFHLKSKKIRNDQELIQSDPNREITKYIN